MVKSKKPNINITGQVQDLNKIERNKPKLKRTRFHLTINLNQIYKDNDIHLQNDIDMFAEVIQDILQNIEKYVRIPETDSWTEEYIKNADISYTIERGLKRGQLHVHILFKFDHNTSIQLNYNAIKYKIKGDLGLPNVFLYNRLLRNTDSDNVIDYLNKYV